jgi:hypothetical protein
MRTPRGVETLVAAGVAASFLLVVQRVGVIAIPNRRLSLPPLLLAMIT